VKELLLCLRPIRDGEDKVDAKHRLTAKRAVSDDSNTQSTGASGEGNSGQSSPSTTGDLPLKKRKKEAEGSVVKKSLMSEKTPLTAEANTSGLADAADVAESLVMMSSKR